AAHLHPKPLHQVEYLRTAAQGEDMSLAPLRPLPGRRIEFPGDPPAPESGQDIQYGKVRPAEPEVLADAHAGKLALDLRDHNVRKSCKLLDRIAQDIWSRLQLLVQQRRF